MDTTEPDAALSSDFSVEPGAGNSASLPMATNTQTSEFGSNAPQSEKSPLHIPNASGRRTRRNMRPAIAVLGGGR